MVSVNQLGQQVMLERCRSNLFLSDACGWKDCYTRLEFMAQCTIYDDLPAVYDLIMSQPATNEWDRKFCVLILIHEATNRPLYTDMLTFCMQQLC